MTPDEFNQLKKWAEYLEENDIPVDGIPALAIKAAKYIEQLQVELAELKQTINVVQTSSDYWMNGYNQLKIELAELKPQATLLRRFLNNANAEIEQLAVENKRLHIEMEKQK